MARGMYDWHTYKLEKLGYTVTTRLLYVLIKIQHSTMELNMKKLKTTKTREYR